MEIDWQGAAVFKEGVVSVEELGLVFGLSIVIFYICFEICANLTKTVLPANSVFHELKERTKQEYFSR